MIDALQRTVAVAQGFGIYAIELYTLTDKAKTFYLRYGFVSLKDDDKHLYLPIETIKNAGLI